VRHSVGRARQAWHGKDWLGVERFGAARQARLGLAWIGKGLAIGKDRRKAGMARCAGFW
jgi:hypothetical protein